MKIPSVQHNWDTVRYVRRLKAIPVTLYHIKITYYLNLLLGQNSTQKNLNRVLDPQKSSVSNPLEIILTKAN